MAVAAPAAVALAVVVPEAGVVGLPASDGGSVLGNDLGAIANDLDSADVVIVGPGLDDAEQTGLLLRRLLPRLSDQVWLVLDAYALAALPELPDVLAGALGGLLGRRAEGAQAACWATYAHAAAGDRLAARVGRLGFLAREILDELPGILVELES